MPVFWDVALCSLIEVHRRFKGAYCNHHQGRPPVNLYESIQSNISEGCDLHFSLFLSFCSFIPFSSLALPLFVHFQSFLFLPFSVSFSFCFSSLSSLRCIPLSVHLHYFLSSLSSVRFRPFDLFRSPGIGKDKLILPPPFSICLANIPPDCPLVCKAAADIQPSRPSVCKAAADIQPSRPLLCKVAAYIQSSRPLVCKTAADIQTTDRYGLMSGNM